MSLVYQATAVSFSRELFAVDFATIPPAPTSLNVHPTLMPGRNIFGWRWSPTGDSLLINANLNSQSQNELFHIDASSGFSTPRRLNGPLAPGSEVAFGLSTLDWSADGRRVAYVVSSFSQPPSAYVVDLAGSGVGVPVSLLPTPGPSSLGLFFSPDSTKLVTVGAFRSVGDHELFLSDVSTGAPTTFERVNPNLVFNGDISHNLGAVIWRSDSTGVFYLADQAVDSVQEAWSVSFIGSATPSIGTSTRMHAPLARPRRVERVLVQTE